MTQRQRDQIVSYVIGQQMRDYEHSYQTLQTIIASITGLPDDSVADEMTAPSEPRRHTECAGRSRDKKKRKRRRENIFIQKQVKDHCAMHALNNVVGGNIFSQNEFEMVSGGTKGLWTTFNIQDVVNNKKTDMHTYYTAGNKPTFLKEELNEMLKLHNELEHVEFCGFVKNVDAWHFIALRYIEGSFYRLNSIGKIVQSISIRQMLRELSNGQVDKNGSTPIWKIHRNAGDLQKLHQTLNHFARLQ